MKTVRKLAAACALVAAGLGMGTAGATTTATAVPAVRPVIPPGVDSYCVPRKISYHHVFYAYAGVDGVGVTAFTMGMYLTVYEHCDHGGIFGYITFDKSTTNQQGAIPHYGFWYQSPYTNGWSSQYLAYADESASADEDVFYVSGIIDLSSLLPYNQSVISPIEFGAYLTYAVDGGTNEIGPARHIECDWEGACANGNGL